MANHPDAVIRCDPDNRNPLDPESFTPSNRCISHTQIRDACLDPDNHYDWLIGTPY